jgi:hypothetical protein
MNGKSIKTSAEQNNICLMNVTSLAPMHYRSAQNLTMLPCSLTGMNTFPRIGSILEIVSWSVVPLSKAKQ